MHQHAFARLQPGGIEQIGPDGEKRLGKGRRIHQVNIVRHHHAGRRRRQRILSIAAAGDQGADPRSHRKIRDAGAQSRNGAGNFHAQRVRRARRRRITALGLQHIGMVQPGGRNLDQHFPRARLGLRALLQYQTVFRAGLFDGDHMHDRVLDLRNI